MTIKEYVKDLEKVQHTDSNGGKLSDRLLEITHIWSNDAARGYTTAAMQRAGYSREQISEVLSALSVAFDEIAIPEAEKIQNT